MPSRSRQILLAFVTLLTAAVLCPVNAAAQAVCPLDSLKPIKVSSLEAFKRIPVLDQGRIKPIDTLARNFLLQLSGRSRYQKETATEWFARFLFAPRTTFDDKVFLINNPELLEAINVEPEKKRRYSYHQLEPGYDKILELARVIDKIEDKDRSVVERELLRLFSNLRYYIDFSGAFAYGFPHPDFTLDSLEVRNLLDLSLERNQFSFYDLFEKTDQLAAASAVLRTKEQDQWNETELTLARLISALIFWTNHYANCPLGIIPTQEDLDEHWLSPMDIINLNANVPAYREEVELIRDMTVHYWNGEQVQFDISARAFMNSVNNRLTVKEHAAVDKIPLELAYNSLGLFLWAKLFYGLGLILVLISLLRSSRVITRLILVATFMGFIPHLIALVMRITILSRPPVSNLYETFIFVGLIGVALGLLLEYLNKDQLGTTVANLCGLVFLMIAGKFGSDGDTMQMLVAVLNSNFWLSTHVIAITTGYAGCCVAGVVGHIYILQLLTRQDKSRLEATMNNMLGILGFGLIMTFLGTALGGIWADQSWGRFWGWDPKENGALLIVLWCAIIFHARIGKMIHPLGVAVGCALGLIVVMWAWFGVNLLSVGLHSYGFTSGIANSLGAYVLAELVFLTVSVLILGKRNIKV